MFNFQRALAVLMATSAVVCGCSCSSKTRGGPEGHGTVANTPAAPAPIKTLTQAQAELIRGRFTGGLQATAGGSVLADVVLTIDAAGSSAPAMVAESVKADQVYNAKLEVSNANLNVVLVSQEITAHADDAGFDAVFAIQNPKLEAPLKLQMNFDVLNGRLQGRLADVSRVGGLLPSTDLISAVVKTHQPTPQAKPKPKPVPKPAPKPTPKPPVATPVPPSAPITVGALFLDLNLNAATKATGNGFDPKKLKPPVTNYFSGATTFGSGTSKSVDVTIQEPDTSSDGALYALVATQGSSQKFVMAQFNYGNGAVLNYVPALLDAKSGKLKAIAFVGPFSPDVNGAPSSRASIQIDCAVKAKQTLDCSHLSAGSEVAQTHLAQAKGPSSGAPQSDNPNAVARVYKGLAQFAATDTRAVDLNVSYQANSSLESILSLLQPSQPHTRELKASFSITGTVTTVPFPEVVFDEKSQTLAAKTTFFLKDVRVEASLICTGFTFGAPDSKFDCIYKNSYLDHVVPFHFPVK